MNIKSALTILFLFFITDQAFAAIDPVYEGANGIRAKVFATNCLDCHSSTLTGSARNGAPPSVNWDTYEAALPNAPRAIVRAVEQMTMPPAFSGVPALNDEQKAAMLAWQSAGFPRAAATTSTAADFSYDSSILTLPVVNVGSQMYNATLRLSSNNSSPTGIAFVLESAQPATAASSVNAANFFPTTGQLTVPLVQLMRNGASQGQVSAELALVPNSSPFLFLLSSYTSVPGAQ
ncbi:c-type cytochrome [Candidatus Methylobacter oryzae]|uniref:Cytochrome c n=1 Tax=Candidatus Methylobacter oryzae TaxID=2497749 RepID=A0ABY3C5L7_9GAMM|nr:cytochrome c [Candidatus Methylobacter oryzae]TRW89934.1 cytochrome c [Candidatus Methylobacter oryzae]